MRDQGNTPGFQTVNCAAGAITPADAQIAIGSVNYANNAATFSVNGGTPLPKGNYRLYVCGTTSIVDPLNTALKLVGANGAGTDFVRNFSVSEETQTQAGSIIPVTGFAPGVMTTLGAQSLAEAYSNLGDLWLDRNSEEERKLGCFLAGESGRVLGRFGLPDHDRQLGADRTCLSGEWKTRSICEPRNAEMGRPGDCPQWGQAVCVPGADGNASQAGCHIHHVEAPGHRMADLGNMQGIRPNHRQVSIPHSRHCRVG
jgi:hypothetical protein